MFTDITLAQAIAAFAFGASVPVLLAVARYLLTPKTHGEDYDQY